MVSINILNKGDEVLSINEKFLAVKRKNGIVDVFKVNFNADDDLVIDPVKMAEIGYGNGTVEKVLEDGETTVFTF